MLLISKIAPLKITAKPHEYLKLFRLSQAHNVRNHADANK